MASLPRGRRTTPSFAGGTRHPTSVSGRRCRRIALARKTAARAAREAVDRTSPGAAFLLPTLELEKQRIRTRRAVGRAAKAILHVALPPRELAVLDEVGELSGPVGAVLVNGHHMVEAVDLGCLPVVAAVARLPGKAVTYRLGDGRRIGEGPRRERSLVGLS